MPWYVNPLVATVIAIISMLGTLLAAGLAAYALRVANRSDQRQVKQDTEDREWAARADKLVKHLIRINPQTSIREPGHASHMGLYTTIFPVREL